jgi:hypothetical protein
MCLWVRSLCNRMRSFIWRRRNSILITRFFWSHVYDAHFALCVKDITGLYARLSRWMSFWFYVVVWDPLDVLSCFVSCWGQYCCTGWPAKSLGVKYVGVRRHIPTCGRIYCTWVRRWTVGVWSRRFMRCVCVFKLAGGLDVLRPIASDHGLFTSDFRHARETSSSPSNYNCSYTVGRIWRARTRPSMECTTKRYAVVDLPAFVHWSDARSETHSWHWPRKRALACEMSK